MKRSVFILICSIFTLCTMAQDTNAINKSYRLHADLGFCHWYADDLRTSVDLTHLTAGLGFNPVPEFLEIRVRYDMSRVEVPASGTAALYNGDYIHFFTGGFALCQTFYHDYQQLTALAGLNVVLPVLEKTVSFGGSLSIGIEYLLHVKSDSRHSFGVFMEVRNQYYKLHLPDGGITDTQCDLILDLGVVAVLW